MSDKHPKVLFVSGREPSYVRNKVMLRCLREHFTVIEVTDSAKSFLTRLPKIFFKLIVAQKNVDIVFVGFYGQILIPLVKLLYLNKSIVFDAYISTYQTLCFDRKRFAKNSLIGRLSFFLDKVSCALADIIILDTNAHINYFVSTYNLPKNKFRRIFVGTDEKIFNTRSPLPISQTRTVFFYSLYQPLHGIMYILKAAEILKNEHVNFKLVGYGQEKDRAVQYCESHDLTNVEFLDWLPFELLPDEIRKCSVFIGGHFGNTQKANMTISGKTFQALALGKVTLVSATKANFELFNDKSKEYFAKQADHIDIANKLAYMINNSEKAEQLGLEQHKIFLEQASFSVISKQLKNVLLAI